MDNFIIALFESSVALILFYLVYALWLRSETIFRENRFYLIIAALVSLIIPWINFSIPQKPAETVLIYNLIDTISVSANGYEKSLVQQISTMQWIALAYAMGALVMLVIFIIKMVKITRIDKQSQMNFGANLPKNVKFIFADVAPFSFLNRIYINPNSFTKNQLIDVIAHENVHIRQQHTYDCLFYELLIVFFWFNPIVYRYRNSAKEIHEFLADEGAIRSGISELDYQKLLFEQATGLRISSLANSFNYSLIKRRLIMLTKIKSSKIAKMRLLYVLPVLLGVLLVFACNQGENAMESPNEKVVINDLNVYDSVEIMPQFPGGDVELRNFIAQNVKYPDDAINRGIEGRVFVQFVVNQDGSIEQVKVVRGVDPALDGEAVRVISSQPKWTPGENAGQKVKVQFTVPINFKLDPNKKVGGENIPVEMVQTDKKGAKEQVFFVVEHMPEFPGGDVELRKFIAENIKYPERAKQAGIQGRVFVQFVVGTDGNVNDAKVVRGVDPDLDAEALRVILTLKGWKPGFQKGQPVNVSFTVPISFQLN